MCRSSNTKKNETNPIAWEPRVGEERQTDGHRTCSDLAGSLYSVQVDASSNIGVFLFSVRRRFTLQREESHMEPSLDHMVGSPWH